MRNVPPLTDTISINDLACSCGVLEAGAAGFGFSGAGASVSETAAFCVLQVQSVKVKKTQKTGKNKQTVLAFLDELLFMPTLYYIFLKIGSRGEQSDRRFFKRSPCQISRNMRKLI
jgi:hypothetical protein